MTFFSEHQKGGPAPYQVLGTIMQGQSVARPKPGLPPISKSSRWHLPTPIIPCQQFMWGIATDPQDGESVMAFSGVTRTKEETQIIYAVMSWMFYKATGHFIFSIEKTMGNEVSFLNVICSNEPDQTALNKLQSEYIGLPPSDTEAWMLSVVEEARA